MTDYISDQTNLGDDAEFNSNDVEWLAFCYIADELDHVERDQFENRLENDELAQQAVADAMQFAQVLYSSLNSTSFNDGKEPVAIVSRDVPANQRGFKRARTTFTAAVVMLVVVAGWAWFSNSDLGNSNAVMASDSDRLASAWVETMMVMSDEGLDDFIEDESAIVDSSDEESDDWMLLALTDLEDSEGAEREAN